MVEVIHFYSVVKSFCCSNKSTDYKSAPAGEDKAVIKKLIDAFITKGKLKQLAL
jgi:hypothetical protein